ncbi:hypothetical protein SBA3_2450010 [Candidatus Sulfopaludibacter sp. SbA3]|nr:hypothetical protein SBA3_2450010 [Candidatus Sulfopaludibacter sp. SbA3]
MDHIEQLIVDLKATLDREIGTDAIEPGSLRHTVRESFAQLIARFDKQGARHERLLASIERQWPKP